MLLRSPLPALLLTVSLLGACAPQAESTPLPTPSDGPSAAPTAPITPVFSPSPTPVPGCTDTTGELRHAETRIPGDERPLTYWLYRPPCFDPDSESSYPTLYLLHGLAQSDSEWPNLGIAETADALITRAAIPPVIIIMPGERTGFDMMSAVTEVLLPEIEASLPVGGQPKMRAIGGLSRGAGWALRIGMQRPDLFGAIGLHSPAVISPDLYSLRTWAAEIPAGSIPRLSIDIGSEDTLLRDALELRDQVDLLRWPYTWTLGRGEHSSTYWSSHLEGYLRWYAAGWDGDLPGAAQGQS